MRNLLLTVVVLGAGGYFGAKFYVQYKAEQDLDALLAQARPFVDIEYERVVATIRGELRAEDALLTMPNGGTARFSYAVPRSDFATGGRLDAAFERLEINTLLSAAGQKVEEKFVSGSLSGEAHLTGLPGDPQGTANARLIEGTIAGQPAEPELR